MQTNSLIKKWLACVIIFLFFGAGIASASYKSTSSPMSTKSKGPFVPEHIAYAFVSGQYNGLAEFYLNDPGNLTAYNGSGVFYVSGVDFGLDGNMYLVTIDGGLYVCNMTTGVFTMIAETIPLYDLAYDPSSGIWYASGSTPDGLYTIDINTGATTYIGSFGISNVMARIMCDNDGNLYGYDEVFSGGSTLYSIDKSTGTATAIGDMGYDFCYGQDGKFDRDNNILYISGFSVGNPSALFTCDPQTAACTPVGDFEYNLTVSALAIPYGSANQYPYADFTWTPRSLFPGDSVLFNASMSSDPSGNITLYEWDWNHDGLYDESHTTPTATHTWTSPGSYIVTLQVTDNAGHKGTKSKTIIIDGINVTIAGTMGNNGWYTSGVVITIYYGNVSNHTYYSFDNQTWTEYTSPVTISTDGIYTLYICCEDPDGKVHYYGPYLFKIDMTPPIISLTVMSLNCLKNKWLINATVYDATSGVAHVEFYIDDWFVGNVSAPGPYTFTYKGKGKVVEAIVYDNAGNKNMQSSEYIPAMNNLQILMLYVLQLFHQMMEQHCHLKR